MPDPGKPRSAGTIERFLDGAPLLCAIFHQRHHLMPDREWPGNISVVCTKCHARWQGIVDDTAHPQSDHSFWAGREAQREAMRAEAKSNDCR